MRRLILAALLLFAVVLGGITAYQWVTTSRLQDGFDAWVQARRAEGWTVSYAPPLRAGWPSRAVLVVPDVRLSGGGWPQWQAERVLLVVRLLRPDTLSVIPQGAEQIGLEGGEAHAFQAKMLRVLVPLDPKAGDPVAELTGSGIRAAGPEVSIGSLQVTLLGVQQGSISFRANAQEVGLPAGGDWPLGAHIASASLTGDLHGQLPGPSGSVAALVRAWRDTGGRLDVAHGAVRWGPLDAELQGDASLDKELQPVATGQARLTGYAQALDLMAARRRISNDSALAAKAVLSLMARTPEGGGAPAVSVPFTVNDDVLSVGPIPLVRLRPIAWP